MLWMSWEINSVHLSFTRGNDSLCLTSNQPIRLLPHYRGLETKMHTFSYVLLYIYLWEVPNDNLGIDFHYHTNGGQFNISCLWSRTQTPSTKVAEHLSPRTWRAPELNRQLLQSVHVLRTHHQCCKKQSPSPTPIGTSIFTRSQNHSQRTGPEKCWTISIDW